MEHKCTLGLRIGRFYLAGLFLNSDGFVIVWRVCFVIVERVCLVILECFFVILERDCLSTSEYVCFVILECTCFCPW